MEKGKEPVAWESTSLCMKKKLDFGVGNNAGILIFYPLAYLLRYLPPCIDKQTQINLKKNMCDNVMCEYEVSHMENRISTC